MKIPRTAASSQAPSRGWRRPPATIASAVRTSASSAASASDPATTRPRASAESRTAPLGMISPVSTTRATRCPWGPSLDHPRRRVDPEIGGGGLPLGEPDQPTLQRVGGPARLCSRASRIAERPPVEGGLGGPGDQRADGDGRGGLEGADGRAPPERRAGAERRQPRRRRAVLQRGRQHPGGEAGQRRHAGERLPGQDPPAQQADRAARRRDARHEDRHARPAPAGPPGWARPLPLPRAPGRSGWRARRGRCRNRPPAPRRGEPSTPRPRGSRRGPWRRRGRPRRCGGRRSGRRRAPGQHPHRGGDHARGAAEHVLGAAGAVAAGEPGEVERDAALPGAFTGRRRRTSARVGRTLAKPGPHPAVRDRPRSPKPLRADRTSGGRYFT